jgi:glutaminase
MQGDVNVPFTLQSCSKPFTYGICLNELGPKVDLTIKRLDRLQQHKREKSGHSNIREKNQGTAI